MANLLTNFRKNRAQYLTLGVLALLFLLAITGMDTRDWVITLLRALAVGSITFLVAAGFSLIFGLMDVLNLAHGTLFMIGAYIGWTFYVRPDTFIDALTPFGLIAVGLVLLPLWTMLLSRVSIPRRIRKLWPWFGLAFALLVLTYGISNYPITIWNPGVFAESPGTYAFQAEQGTLTIPAPRAFTTTPTLVLLANLVGGLLLGFSAAGFSVSGKNASTFNRPVPRTTYLTAVGLFVLALVCYGANGSLTDALVGMSSNLRFLLTIFVAVLGGVGLGTVVESSLIRPLYDRPIYQLMMTLGLSLIGIEIVRAVWGRPEFTMPKPSMFTGTGEGCPAASFADLVQYQCSTFFLLDGRVRTYNEIFVPLVGVIVLVLVWMLLQRTRLGMVIRAGVQDGEMVEALGINVRRVFTMVFALGVGLATLGGVIAGPSMGLSSGMGESLLLKALIALAIGGLTSFPGAAAGSLLVGLMEQFIIKYGAIGINIPFLAEPFKPTPPLVPASTVLLMVIVLLALPNGLFGRNE